MFSLKRIFFTFLITIKLFIFKSKQNNKSENKQRAGLKNCRRRGGFFVKKCSFIIHFRREQFIKCVEMDNLVCVEDFEKAALKIWDENAAGYYTR